MSFKTHLGFDVFLYTETSPFLSSVFFLAQRRWDAEFSYHPYQPQFLTWIKSILQHYRLLARTRRQVAERKVGLRRYAPNDKQGVMNAELLRGEFCPLFQLQELFLSYYCGNSGSLAV